MSVATWSYLLAALNIGGLFLSWQVGNKRREAWLGYVLWNAVWIVYAVDTGSWGFIASASAFIAIALRNYAKWREDASVPQAGPTS
jgi:hypothetical protein